ncbi:flavodoxin family protein [Ohtaekwangia koreensis]|uniref:Multimeric flavodoxin WrbA n=1 Tax=Ohtaekwangia koreensis TaxID=688867 RepID=A0A1T5M5Z2_9BACT|nr:flavodoxin family protein [Ohtaekwangia koreensis]SKC83543.1 Multimeric flavodoxin WrbA [Ohtaekwangia koreensis]
MKTLIVYYSYTHNNEVLANVLQEKLKCDIFKIEEVKKRNAFAIMLDLVFNRIPKIKPRLFDVGSYDRYIFVAPIWAGKIASPLKTFLVEERFYISDYSFITICGGQTDQKEKLVTNLTKILGHEPSLVQELSINNLLSGDKKNTMKYTSSYRIQSDDMIKFNVAIDDFLRGGKASDARERKAG